MAAHNELGKWGEQVAADYLEAKGWRILHRDWKFDHKDLDIVCIDNKTNMIVFVEVKTRSTDLWGEPSDAIDLKKKNNIINAATAYLREYRLFGRTWRYDCISIVGSPETTHTIEHKENIADVLDKFAYQQQKRNYSKQRNGIWGVCRWNRW